MREPNIITEAKRFMEACDTEVQALIAAEAYAEEANAAEELPGIRQKIADTVAMSTVVEWFIGYNCPKSEE